VVDDQAGGVVLQRDVEVGLRGVDETVGRVCGRSGERAAVVREHRRGAVHPIHAGSRIGATQDGNLVAQHEEFDVFGGGCSGHQQDQSEHLPDQVQQPTPQETRAVLAAWAAAGT